MDRQSNGDGSFESAELSQSQDDFSRASDYNNIRGKDKVSASIKSKSKQSYDEYDDSHDYQNMYSSPEADSKKRQLNRRQARVEDLDEYDSNNGSDQDQLDDLNAKDAQSKSSHHQMSKHSQEYAYHDEEDDGQGIHSQERHSINLGTQESADNFDTKMNQLTKFISEHDDREISEEGYGKTTGRPRDTYQVFMDKIDNRLKRIKDINMPFEERKHNLVKDNYQFSEEDWREILKYDTPK